MPGWREPAVLFFHLKRQPGVIDQPLDQTVPHRRAGRPDPAQSFWRIAQQADRAFHDHLRGRSIAGIAVAVKPPLRCGQVRQHIDENYAIASAMFRCVEGLVSKTHNRRQVRVSL